MSVPNLGEDAIFNTARRIAAPAARGEYLQQACGDDLALRTRLDALLAVHDQELGFLQAPALDALGTIDESAARTQCPQEPDSAGAVIGPYRLLEQVGEGGFGIVFMAEQQAPIRRQVALKVLKPGMDSKQIIARMEAERQALALMAHPNIATMLDAGQTADGRPYFVMDLVRGVPITEYCDQAQLTPAERLKLFIDVCQAVHHAHQRGIIHRDIKPSNVLVTLHDGKPVVKVIDFGIAKALGQQLTDKTLFTGFTQMIGTPLYMSPEQAALSDVDVDTRSDIYSLGVLLYELLTGTTPFDRKRLREAGFDEVRRIIREEEPAKPSTRISDLEPAAATTVSARRRSDPRRLSSMLRGELDWIVMTALEKDRDRRYGTASALAEDIERYLHDEPVQACPPSTWYRWSKFARRNKAALAIAALSLLFIVLLGSGGGWAVRDRAAREDEILRDQAARQTVLEERVMHARTLATEAQAQGQWTDALAAALRAEELLASGGSDELRRQVRQLRGELEMVCQVADVRLRSTDDKDGAYDIGLRDAAYAQLFREHGLDLEKTADRAEAARRIRSQSTCLEVAAALHDWAVACRRVRPKNDTTWKDLLTIARAADPDAWRNKLRDAWERLDAEALEKLAAYEKAGDLPAPTLALLGELLAATGSGEAAVQLLQRAQVRYPADFWINHGLAMALQRMQPPRLDQAIGYYRAAVAVRPQSPGVYVNLGMALAQKGWLDEAIAMYQKAIRLNKGIPVAHHNLGFALWKTGKLDEAIAEFQEAVSLRRDDARWHKALGDALLAKGRLDEAIVACQEAIRLNKDFAGAHAILGAALGGTGRWDEAIAECRLAIGLDKDLPLAHYNLGNALVAKGHVDEAMAEFREAIELNQDYAQAHNNLGACLRVQGRLEEAIREHREALRLKPDLCEAHINLGTDLRDKGDLDEAIAEFQHAIDVNKDSALAHSELGFALFCKGRLDEALAACQEAVHLDKHLPEARNYLGIVLHAKGRLDEAIVEVQEAIRLKKDMPEAHVNLGIGLHAKGRLDEAFAEFQKAIGLKKDYALAHAKLGDALRDKGRLDEAIAEFQEAIRLKNDVAWVHCNLGLAFCAKGEFIQALPSLRRGHELQSTNSSQASASAKWVRDCELMAALEKKLPDILSGKQEAADTAERLGVARLCQDYKKKYAAAARFYAEAFTAQPSLNGSQPSMPRYKAACAAGLAGCGQGVDAPVDDKESARLRRQALDWLHAELAALRGILDKAQAKTCLAVAQHLKSWREDASLDGVRDTKALARLPAAERGDWQNLWQEIEGVRQAALAAAKVGPGSQGK